MNLNFDFREFQKESMERLQKIYAEAMIDQEITEDYKSTYEKMQKILKCKEMEKCHPYLFTLDRQCLNEEDIQKIEELYECGRKRGFILEDNEETEETEIDDECYDDQLCGGPDDSLTGQEMTPQELPEMDSSSNFTVLYSAMKNNEVKMGEFYSNAMEEKGAKEDCVLQLTEAGYNNIKVMAVEQIKTAVDTEVTDDTAVSNLFENLFEDDSTEFEKQETGDVSSGGSGEPEEVTQTDTVDTTVGVPDEESTQDMGEVTDDSEGVSDASEEGVEAVEDDTDEEETEEDSETQKELSSAEKTALKDEYQKLFKDILKKSEMNKSVNEMTISETIDFLKQISEKWSKNDPSEFLSVKDKESLNKYVPEQEEA